MDRKTFGRGIPDFGKNLNFADRAITGIGKLFGSSEQKFLHVDCKKLQPVDYVVVRYGENAYIQSVFTEVGFPLALTAGIEAAKPVNPEWKILKFYGGEDYFEALVPEISTRSSADIQLQSISITTMQDGEPVTSTFSDLGTKVTEFRLSDDSVSVSAVNSHSCLCVLKDEYIVKMFSPSGEETRICSDVHQNKLQNAITEKLCQRNEVEPEVETNLQVETSRNKNTTSLQRNTKQAK